MALRQHGPEVVSRHGAVRQAGAEVSREHVSREHFDERMATHLIAMLSISAGMVGVCLTAIGLIGIARSLTKLETVCDDVLAANSLVYLVAAGLSFACLRTRLRDKGAVAVLAVDVAFCAGLMLTVAACVMLVWFVV